MKYHGFWKKAAKNTICWLLIFGMLVTLPQLPVSAMTVSTETGIGVELQNGQKASDNKQSGTGTTETTESTESGTETTETTESTESETEVIETTESTESGTETIETTESTENSSEETEIAGGTTESTEAQTAGNNGSSDTVVNNIKAAATSTDVTVHFKNENDWETVYAKFGAGDSWDVIEGLEYCKNSEFGGVLEENSQNEGWYSFRITKSDTLTINGLFNNGSWGGENQTGNFSIPITADTMEVWITNGVTVSEEAPEGWVTGGTATAPINPADLSDIKSPVINEDGSVTFSYEIGADKLGENGLYLMGTITDWETGAEMTDEDQDGVYTITISDVAPGKYEYKFKYGDTWVTDPANGESSNGNSLLVVAGLGNTEIEAKTGEATALPATLDFYDAEGKVTKVTPDSYAIVGEVDGASIREGELTLTDEVTAETIQITASYKVQEETYTSTVTVKVVSVQYTYHIYYYADNEERVTTDSAALWLYGDNVNGTLHPFTDTEDIDGYTWLKCDWVTSLDDISIIARDPDDWSWQSATVHYENTSGAEEVNLYIVHGDTKAYTSQPDLETLLVRNYVLVEYKRNDGNYDGWNIYTWDSGYDETVLFSEYEGAQIAPVRVAGSKESISFCMRYSTDDNEWEAKDGGDHMVNITPGQRITKVVFEEGKGIVSYYPDNMGYETLPESGKVNFYYRDDDLYLENQAGNLYSVKVVYDGTSYDMSYNEETQRWEKSGLDLTEGAHQYYYLVKETEESEETRKIDLFNDKAEESDNPSYSILEYYKFNANVNASFSRSSMDYGDNNVLTFSVDSDDADGNAEFKASAVTVDLTAVGGRSDFPIKPELMEGSIAVTEQTAAGSYSLPVTVTDQYGNQYTGSATLQVKEREKGNDFDWDEAVIYFAVTDRFFDGNTGNNDAYGAGDYNTDEATGSLSYHGGDFAGLTQKLDYLEQLGVNTIWITPIVANEMEEGLETDLEGTLSYGYHGYWASDFTTLNAHLGTEEEFAALLDEVHARGMKLMVDVVLNHAGYETEDYFNSMLDGKDMIRSGENLIEGDTKRGPLSGLPDFMTEDEDVRNLLVEWQSSWISKYDIDYYRVDTVKHVDDVTWAAFKNALTKIDPDFKMIGEYSGAGYASDTGTLRTGEMDSLLDFDFNDQALSFVQGNIDSVESFMEQRNAAIDNTATLGAFTSSHDEDGLMQKIIDAGYTEDEAYQMFFAAASLQMTAKGQVVIYYGEEIGQYGKNDYPYQTNRYDFDWSKAQLADGRLNTGDPMLAHYQKLLAAREDYSEVFAKGERTKISGGDDEGYLVFEKTYQEETVYVGINLNDSAVTVDNISVKGSGYSDVYGGARVTEQNGKLSVTIPALADGGTVILAHREAAAVSLDKNAATLEKGQSLTLKATVTPADSKETLVWTSSDSNVASVTQSGVVTAKGSGKAVVTVTLSGGASAACEITVTETEIHAQAISLNKTKLELKKGKTYTLKATVTPAGSVDGAVTFKSSKTSVATVSSNGVVTAKKAGTATITATTANGKKATCKVTVTVPATKVYLTKQINIKKGATKKLTATVLPTDSTDKLTWSSSNKKVVTVDKNGKIKGVKTGTATITVKTASGKKATCKVTVVKNTKKASKITLSSKTLSLSKGKYRQLNASLSTGATDTVTWSSSNKKVATVDKNGVITALKKGTATITAKTSGGKKATCKVTVTVPADDIYLTTSVNIKKGSTKTLTPTVFPESSNEKITWSSSNKKVVTVDKNGKIKGIKTGTATITAKTASGKKATCKVTVVNKTKKAATVKLNKTTLSLSRGDYQQLKAQLTKGATDTVTWKSSNKKVVTVDKNGVIKAVKKGTATITVKTSGGEKAVCKITVK